MSLVTTAICSESRMRLQSASTSAVLPEPTGPPTPTRRVSFVISFLLSGPEQSRVLRLVSRAREEVHRRGVANRVVGHQRRSGSDGRDLANQRIQHALPSRLTERHGLHGGKHLILRPRPKITVDALADTDAPANTTKREKRGKRRIGARRPLAC